VPADGRRCRDGGHGGAMREHNVADTCRQPLIFTARARRAGIRRAPPRQQKERAVLFEIHGAFSDRLSLSLSLSLFLRLFVLSLSFSLSLSLSRARARAFSPASSSRGARQPRDVKYFRGGKGLRAGGKRSMAGSRYAKRSTRLEKEAASLALVRPGAMNN